MIDFELIIALKETIIMILIPTIFSIILGIPLGALLFLTGKNGIYEKKNNKHAFKFYS